MKSIVRYAASLTVVLGAYWLYSKIAVPLIEPSIARGSRTRAAANEPSPIRSRYNLAALFPPGSWELDRPKVIETNQGMLLIKDYETDDDGILRIKPCTMVLFAGDEDDDNRRPFILQAPGGAELQFDSGIDISRGEFGALRGGQLIGEITIHSPASKPGADDDVQIVTRNVQIDRRRIMAPHEVRLRYGPHVGQGRDLIITLSESTADEDSFDRGSALGAIETLELVHVDKLTVQVDEQALLPKGLGAGDGPAALAAGPAAEAQRGDEVQITCAGPFVFDVAARQAWFEEQVAVVRLNPIGPADALHCQRLLIELAARDEDAGGALSRMRVRRVIATGAVATAHADEARDVVIRFGKYEIHSPRIEYEPPLDDPQAVGRLRAAGPGSFAAQSDDDAKASITAFWSGELQFRPFQQNQVLSLYASPPQSENPAAQPAETTGGDRLVRVGVAGQGDVTAGEIHLYLLQVAPDDPRASAFSRIVDRHKAPRVSPAASGSADRNRRAALQPAPATAARQPDRPSRPAIIPDRLLAKDRVEFDSPLLVGDADEINIWFDYSLAAAPSVAGSPNGEPGGISAPIQLPSGDDGGSRRRYELHGQLVQVKLMMAAPQPQVDDITISGETRPASFAEVAGSAAGEMLSVSGRLMRLYDGATTNPKLKIEGAPAVVSVRGLTVQAADIRLHQGENRLWIDGAGSAAMTPGMSGAHSPAHGPRRVRLAWRDNMTFDGWQVRVRGEVTVDGEHVLENGDMLRSTALGDSAVLTLDRRVDFARTDEVDEAQPRLLQFSGPVQVENVTTKPQGAQQSFDQMSVLAPTIHVISGDIEARGAGWISTVRYSNDISQKSGFAGRAAPGGDNPGRLMFLRINYKDGLTGNHLERKVTFHTVRAFVAPAADWTTQFDPDKIDSLHKDEMLLTCRKLTVVDMGPSIGARGALEMQAEENAEVQGVSFTAAADRISYSQQKDMLHLTSNGLRRVSLTAYLPRTNQPSALTAASLKYFPGSGQMEGEDIRSAVFSGAELPGLKRR